MPFSPFEKRHERRRRIANESGAAISAPSSEEPLYGGWLNFELKSVAKNVSIGDASRRRYRQRLNENNSDSSTADLWFTKCSLRKITNRENAKNWHDARTSIRKLLDLNRPGNLRGPFP